MNRLERLGVIALCAAVGWFYLWTVRSSGDPWDFGLEQRDYYNLLIDGWLEGQLHMKVEVPEELARLKDPYDPAQRPPGIGLHDATFYKGKYYLYFGVAPVVVLMLPFRLLTGIDLPLAVATLGFVYGGFLIGVAIWLAIRRRYFPGAGSWVVLGGVLVLGLAGLGPVLLRRPHMWELPIGAGGAFAMLALWCLWQSLHVPRSAGTRRRERRRAWWFGWAGLALGLAIASRPTYLIASPFLVVPLLAWWRAEGRLPWRAVLRALVPLALVGAAMAWHNAARFDHPLQFGQAYQLSLDYESKMAHFRATHVPFNVWRYFFSAAEWSRYFPFIHPAALPPKPPGFGGHDDVYGILTNLPVAWLALLAPLALWRRDQTERRALGTWLVTVAVLFAGMAGTLIFFFGSLARYQSDFTPALMLLAGVGLAAGGRWLRERPGRPWLIAGGVAAAGLVGFSAAFGVLYSLQLDALLLDRNPNQYRAVARLLNRVPAAVEHAVGVRHGPVELRLRLAPAVPGARELLLTAGDAPGWDRVFLVHHEDGRIGFEVESGHGIQQATPPVAIDRGREHRVWVSMGSLLPPESHPLLGAVSEVAAMAMTRRLRIDFDGQTLLDVTPWFAMAPGEIRTAGGGGQAAPGGTLVLAVRRDEGALAGLCAEGEARAREELARKSERGAAVLQVSLPRGRTGRREPLIVTGRPGRGDFVAIEYGENSTVRFVCDHWGGVLQQSEPVGVDYDRPHEIRIVMDTLRAAHWLRTNLTVTSGRLEVWLDGKNVWRTRGEFFVANPLEVAVARNPIGGTTCEAEFTGQVHRLDSMVRGAAR